jgi:glutamine amidotransferase
MKNTKVCILDYGSGNVASVYNLLNCLDYKAKISNNSSDIKDSSHIILPGVGAFGASIEKIRNKIEINLLENEVKIKKKPFLGICVGMQILADKGFEFGEHDGLGWIEGTVEKIKAKVLPHIGWNNIQVKKQSPIFSNIENSKDFYFVNSYAFNVKDKNLIISETSYGSTFCSAVQKDNIFGVQFHPEKSQKAGQLVMHNFLKL